MDAPILKVIAQRHENDCGVACLAMLLGVSYENALVAIAQTEPNVCARGLYFRDLTAAAKRLGYRLTRRKQFDIEADTGILNLSSHRWRYEHLVILREGLILETDGTLWEAAVYLAHHKATSGTLLEAEAL